MSGQKKRHVRRLIPTGVGIHVFLYGLACGIAAGATRISEFPEEATSLGVIVFVNFTLGLWLSIKVTGAILSFVARWSHSLAYRADQLMARIEVEGVTLTRVTRFSIGMTLVHLRVFIFAYCAFNIVFWTAITTISGIQLIVESQTGIHWVKGDPAVTALVPLMGLAIVLVSLCYQAGYLLWLDRVMDRLERWLDAQEIPASHEVKPLDVGFGALLNKNLRRLDVFAHRFLGQKRSLVTVNVG